MKASPGLTDRPLGAPSHIITHSKVKGHDAELKDHILPCGASGSLDFSFVIGPAPEHLTAPQIKMLYFSFYFLAKILYFYVGFILLKPNW